MDCYVVEGGIPLHGEITLQGAKNSVLPILSATILNKGISVIENCPDIKDVDTAIEILKKLGCLVFREKGKITVDSSSADRYIINQGLMKRMRSSIMFLGSMLSANHKAVVYYPGGCSLGRRPVDLHIDALKRLNVSIYEICETFYCICDEIKCAEITLPFPSVGATENVMLAAVLAKGTTLLKNAAREPEICDLQGFLNAMGADVSGAGTDSITINGVTALNPKVTYKVIPDRIACVTYLSAAAATGGRIRINDTEPLHVINETEAFRRMNCKVTVDGKSIELDAGERRESFGVIETKPYPGFPTDSQPFMCITAAGAKQKSIIKENIFNNRFSYALELKKLKYDLTIDNNGLTINKSIPVAGNVTAYDLRGGAALVIAGLCAKGKSVISDIEHIDRGYENFESVIKKLGGKIIRTNETEENN